MFKKIKHVHFVGIGGIGMSGIAEILLNMGYKISGSDLKLTEVTDRLEQLGAIIVQGHHENNIGNADVVVYSSAVHDSNPEVSSARRRKIPTIRRAEMLAELMRMKYGIAIAGTHGKTTTTSMLGMVLTEAGLDTTIIVGGKVKIMGTSAKLGAGEYLVAEADEFDRSFLKLTPTIAVITTIEAEHLDCYINLEEIKTAFVEFANKVPFYGSIILCLDEISIQSIIPRLEKQYITYGLSSQADLHATNLKFDGMRTDFVVYARERRIGTITLNLPGQHNVKNALATIAVAMELGISFDCIQYALNNFTGVHRRFEKKAEINQIMIIDDYAHHPTEIEATLQAAKDSWQRRVIAVFQPHLYTRTRDFYQEFGKSFYNADILIVTDIYPAREQPIDGVTGELIANAAKSFGYRNVVFIAEPSEIIDYLKKITKSGDIIITFGAGDIWKVGELLIEELKSVKVR